jgi:hypothetical protein
LNQATTTVLGGIKLGANLTYNSSTDQVDATDTNTVYSLPAASGSTRGGIRVGSYLSVSGDILSVSSVPSHSHSYAATNHSHSEYASSSHGHTIGYSNLDSYLSDRIQKIASLVYPSSSATPFTPSDRPEEIWLRNRNNTSYVGKIVCANYGSSGNIGIWFQRYILNSTTSTSPSFTYLTQSFITSA